MKYEIEIRKTSYLTCTVEADNPDDAKDAAWRWYEDVTYTDDADAEIVYCEERP